MSKLQKGKIGLPFTSFYHDCKAVSYSLRRQYICGRMSLTNQTHHRAIQCAIFFPFHQADKLFLFFPAKWFLSEKSISCTTLQPQSDNLPQNDVVFGTLSETSPLGQQVRLSASRPLYHFFWQHLIVMWFFYPGVGEGPGSPKWPNNNNGNGNRVTQKGRSASNRMA